MSAAYHYRLECEAREWIELVRGKSEAHRLSKAIQRQLERGAP